MIQGSTVENDVIFNTTKTKFSLADRLKLLIGGVSCTTLEIETGHKECIINSTKARTNVQYPEWINRIRNRNRTGYGEPILGAVGQTEKIENQP